MKLYLLTILLLITSQFLAQSAAASLFLEPHFSENFIASKDSSIFSQYGSRLSLSRGKLALGLDYATAKFKDKTTHASIKYEDQFSRTQIGLFLCYSLGQAAGSSGKGGFNTKRIWATYILSAKDNVTSSSGFYNSGDVLSGSGLELGMSKKLFSVFSGYMAIRKITLSTVKDSSGLTTTLTGENIQNIYNLEFGIGIPMSFF